MDYTYEYLSKMYDKALSFDHSTTIKEIEKDRCFTKFITECQCKIPYAKNKSRHSWIRLVVDKLSKQQQDK